MHIDNQQWVDQLQPLAQQGDLAGLKSHVLDFPISSGMPLETDLQCLVRGVADVLAQAQDIIADPPKRQEPASLTELIKKIEHLQEIEQPYNPLGQFETDVYQVGAGMKSLLKKMQESNTPLSLVRALMHLHVPLLVAVDAVQPLIDEACVTCAVQDGVHQMLKNQLAGNCLPHALLALEVLRHHGLASTTPDREVSELARRFAEPLFTRNMPPMANPPDTFHSPMDRLVMFVMQEGTRFNDLPLLPFHRLDELAQHDQDVRQSFLRIVNNPLLINEMFTYSHIQRHAVNHLVVMSQAHEVEVMGQTVKLYGPSNPHDLKKRTTTPLEAFYNVLAQENGLQQLGASSLYAQQTKMSIERVLGQRGASSHPNPPSSKLM